MLSKKKSFVIVIVLLFLRVDAFALETSKKPSPKPTAYSYMAEFKAIFTKGRLGQFIDSLRFFRKQTDKDTDVLRKKQGVENMLLKMGDNNKKNMSKIKSFEKKQIDKIKNLDKNIKEKIKETTGKK